MVILQFLVVAAALAVIDAVRSKLMNPFQRSHIGDLPIGKPPLGYAAAFYVVYIAGVVFFALRPALDGGGWLTAVIFGAALGAFAYATYGLTKAASMRTWPLQHKSWTSCGVPPFRAVHPAGWLEFRST